MNLASFLPGKLPFPSSKTSASGSGVKAPRLGPPHGLAFSVRACIFFFLDGGDLPEAFLAAGGEAGAYVDKAQRQQQHSFEVAPRRGILYDRNLNEMAVSVLGDSIFAVPYEISDSKDPVETPKRSWRQRMRLRRWSIRTRPTASHPRSESTRA